MDWETTIHKRSKMAKPPQVHGSTARSARAHIGSQGAWATMDHHRSTSHGSTKHWRRKGQLVFLSLSLSLSLSHTHTHTLDFDFWMNDAVLLFLAFYWIYWKSLWLLWCFSAFDFFDRYHNKFHIVKSIAVQAWRERKSLSFVRVKTLMFLIDTITNSVNVLLFINTN